ncbi:MAG: glutamate--tRNA ligase [Sedimentisphaerales bacterium]|nr:glutamate--tRNA ligase [Sedimentisphaerales bacterium]
MPQKVVTRFAPSPTGYLHVGGARTALFNWLWARRNSGTFILRIEDTDQKRNTLTATKQVMDDLRWLGIEWDEGPEVGGPNGPYLQSQRMDIYEKYIRQLIDEKKAYYCFETSQELDELREEAEADKKGFSYKRPEKFPTHEDAQKAREEGRPVTVRFAVPQDKPVVVNDVIRGEITFAPSDISDFIIQKSDGFPTYNFACVIDDHLMKVTHIIRGQEHLNNTPGQQTLWIALGFGELPKYAHMSVTISESGGKLSKRERPAALRTAIKAMPDIDLDTLASVGGISRQELDAFLEAKSTPDMPIINNIAEYLKVPLPEINIVDFSKSGYIPETMVNFLALLGWNPGDSREIMKIDELVEAFDVSRLTKSNSLFDRQKLVAFNTEHLKMVPREKLLGYFKAYLKEIDSPVSKTDDETLLRIIKLCEGARTLADIERKSRFLFLSNEEITYEQKAIEKVLLKGDGFNILKTIRSRIETQTPVDAQNIEAMLMKLAEEKKIGLGKVAQPLRVALCGSTISISIFEAVEMLGKENTLARIDKTIKVVEGKAAIGGF